MITTSQYTVAKQYELLDRAIQDLVMGKYIHESVSDGDDVLNLLYTIRDQAGSKLEIVPVGSKEEIINEIKAVKAQIENGEDSLVVLASLLEKLSD